jgi:hypothetical protein
MDIHGSTEETPIYQFSGPTGHNKQILIYIYTYIYEVNYNEEVTSWNVVLI